MIAGNVDDAYVRCESVTRRAAANFYYGIRLLPREKRRAMCAVYAFARRVDDIGDGPIEAREKVALLDAADGALRALPTVGIDPVMVALADAQARFGLPLDALAGLIEGVRMDVAGTSYETFEELVVYCRRVAGTIGRLCLAIFGARTPEGTSTPPDPGARTGTSTLAGTSERANALADDLGVAMQLTNIVRDIREDAERGRIYIPREDLVRYSVSADGRFDGGEGQMDALTCFQANRAEEWFERGLAIVPLLDRRSGACVLAMANIYRDVLRRIADDPSAARRARVSLPVWRKGWVATRSLLAAATG